MGSVNSSDRQDVATEVPVDQSLVALGADALRAEIKSRATLIAESEADHDTLGRQSERLQEYQRALEFVESQQ